MTEKTTSRTLSSPDKSFSPALCRRLPAYYRVLIRLYAMGKEKISSEELAAEMGLAASLVRADMKALGCAGQRSYGYGIPALYKAIGGILQLCDRYGAVIVGSSPFAETLKEDKVFSRRGIRLVSALEDGRDEELLSVISEKSPEIVIFCGSFEAAGRSLEAIESGEAASKVVAVWNFTDGELFSEKITVKNVHLSDILIELCSQL